MEYQQEYILGTSRLPHCQRRYNHEDYAARRARENCVGSESRRKNTAQQQHAACGIGVHSMSVNGSALSLETMLEGLVNARKFVLQ